MAKCSAASSFAVYIYFQLFRVLRFTSINSVLPTSYPSTLVPAARFLSWNAYRSLSECIDPCLNVFRMYFCLNVFLFCLFAMQSIGNGGGSARASPRARPLEQFPTHHGRNYTPLPPPAHASLLPASPAPRATRSSHSHGAKFPFFLKRWSQVLFSSSFFFFEKEWSQALPSSPAATHDLGNST